MGRYLNFHLMKSAEKPQTPVRIQSDICLESEFRSNNYPDSCPKTNRQLSRLRLLAIHGQRRHSRSTRKKEKRTPVNGKIEVTIGVVVVLVLALSETLVRAPVRHQIGWYIAALALALFGDFLNLFGRSLAPQTRYLLSGLLVLYMVCMYILNVQLYIVTAVLSLVVIMTTVCANNFWLDAYNWDMSDEVKTAITNSPETIAAEIWQTGGGRAKARTLMLSLGCDFTDEILDGTFRPLFILGVLCSQKRYAKREASVRDAARKDYDALYKEYQELIQKHTRESNSFDELKQYLEGKAKKAEKERDVALMKVTALEKENTRLKTEWEKMQGANNELVEAVKEIDTMEETEAELAPEEKIVPIRPVDKYAGLSMKERKQKEKEEKFRQADEEIAKYDDLTPEQRAEIYLRYKLSCRDVQSRVSELSRDKINKIQQRVLATA